MADYGKKKNDDLIALCKERGLPHTGKKADFVQRLEEYDSQHASGAAPTSTAKPVLEDEIDWDDEPPATEIAKTATTTQAADAIAAGGIGAVSNPVAVPNQTVAEDPATTNDLTVAAAPVPAPAADSEAPAAKEASPEKDYGTGLAERTIDEELARRKARAKKFGLPEDNDEIKMLERARRFGVVDAGAVPGMLNQALSEGRKREGRGEKRGLEGGLGVEAEVRKRSRGVRQRSRRPLGAGAGKKEGGGVGGVGGVGETGGGGWSEADKAKAEARKQRFAAPAAVTTRHVFEVHLRTLASSASEAEAHGKSLSAD
ncbi:hypothetical protein LTR91_003831 [Friedmanniomyces endolithicus]|uniref:SAP domain-containing protein n=1 Tax=Friedmanniomyces endolithicus TaxID=329885 RepID=A0AAN6KXM1_9PEZI|nr:hypothetical protein LTS09_003241 [Friedmanniomyces endolithicus]KAK0275562.1 hypothetical protein LTS00_014997 [Friedmanniomyces endolithicus]KAK0281606.1 hypothetical protein LTR35_007285 [Friedmanniomyces endolithicus]KAK0927361.1 hypothetical protein LTR57_003524 [Friedmanniomyces endolithicus]KAK0954340.1 hypothetical protein LTS01_023960 [Friedmanniomyces endolithicus]